VNDVTLFINNITLSVNVESNFKIVKNKSSAETKPIG
jgi:hypothetical protein